jgi:hypothetical protein
VSLNVAVSLKVAVPQSDAVADLVPRKVGPSPAGEPTMRECTGGFIGDSPIASKNSKAVTCQLMRISPNCCATRASMVQDNFTRPASRTMTTRCPAIFSADFFLPEAALTRGGKKIAGLPHILKIHP